MRTLAAILSLVVFIQNAAIQVDVNLVQVIVTVTDQQGEFVRNLKADDFVVDEDNERRPITLFNSTLDTPISVGILLDDSLSMQFATVQRSGNFLISYSRWNTAVAVSRALVRTLKPHDEFLLMKFANRMSIVQPFTSDRNKIESFLRELGPYTFGTDLVKSVDDALVEVKKGRNRGCGLVVVTDAEDNGGRNDKAMKEWISTHELPVYTFAIRSPVAGMGTGKVPVDTTLKALDLDEARRRTTIVDTGQLGDNDTQRRILHFVQDIDADLRGQYLIGYPSKHSGSSWERVIRIRSLDPNYKVQMRRDTLRVGNSP